MTTKPQNLYQLLKNAAETSSAGVTVYPHGSALKSTKRQTYQELFTQAKQDAKLIPHLKGISSGSKILLHFSDHGQAIKWFWAVTVAGYLPVMSPPFTNDLTQRQKHLSHVNTLLKDPVMLTSKKQYPDFLGLEELNVQAVEDIESTGAAKGPTGDSEGSQGSEDLAVLMLTSGSTGASKAVSIRQGQLLTAIAGKSSFHKTNSDDVFLNWIGMDHVASMCETHLHAIMLGAEQVHVQADDLLVNPISFLSVMHKHRVAYTFAPNFFLASLDRALSEIEESSAKVENFDLSCLKVMISGGEANVTETMHSVTEKLAQFGHEGDVISPGFGMTETCAGSIYGNHCPSYDIEQHHEFSSLGTCIPGIEMRIETDDGKAASEGEVGNLQVTGPVVFKDYYNNPEATSDSFTKDGWFKTGDRASIDAGGNLNLAGRAKESIIINGVKYFPHELETVLDETAVAGTTPSYNIVFPFRPKGAASESLVVVYVPTYEPSDVEARVKATDVIAQTSGMVYGVRPHDIIPLTKAELPKSSLGKISRAKVRTAYESGKYDEIASKNNNAIKELRMSRIEKPENDTEAKILDLFSKRFNIPAEEVSVTSSLWDVGVSSIDLINFKQRIQDGLGLEEEIPLITILTNPSIRGMSNALVKPTGPQPYDPVVKLQTNGSKTPLWLVHPGVGEVLVFLNLAKYFSERPVYALRARGFNEGEEYFQSIEEIVEIYHKSIKQQQPEGPYAIAGYSFGTMLAFEVGKVLEANGDEVGFCGSFNLPPHIKYRMRQLDWIEVVLNLAYFLDLMTEEYAHIISPEMHTLSHEEVLDHIWSLAPQARIDELSLDKPKLATWASLAHAMQWSARDYEPGGEVSSMDIFYAIPLAIAAKSKDDWRYNHLAKWQDFVGSELRFHEVDGAHYTMMGPEHVFSFQKHLKNALKERGL